MTPVGKTNGCAGPESRNGTKTIRVGIADENELFAIQLRLGTPNRVQAVAEGVRQGLIGLGAEP